MSLHPLVTLLQDLARGAGSLVAPAVCVGCRSPLPSGAAPGELLAGASLCARCRARLEPIGAACRFCGRSRPQDGLRCRACADEPAGGVAGTVALLRYRRVTRRLLHRLKYEGIEELADPLGRSLGARARAVLGPPHPALVVVPVPLHPWRRFRRGYDQAACLADAVAVALERPALAALRRRRWTRALFQLPHEERARVVGGAFRVLCPERVRGRPVLLVDDIRTSGATLRAAAGALRAAGAARVVAAVVAR